MRRCRWSIRRTLASIVLGGTAAGVVTLIKGRWFPAGYPVYGIDDSPTWPVDLYVKAWPTHLFPYVFPALLGMLGAAFYLLIGALPDTVRRRTIAWTGRLMLVVWIINWFLMLAPWRGTAQIVSWITGDSLYSPPETRDCTALWLLFVFALGFLWGCLWQIVGGKGDFGRILSTRWTRLAILISFVALLVVALIYHEIGVASWEISRALSQAGLWSVWGLVGLLLRRVEDN